MLLENFYKIIHIKEREDGKQAIEIELNPGHVLYQGHFPGQPVVPGVCTLQIIKESAEQIANQPLQYVQIASSKFLSAINPLETPLLQLFIRLEKTEALWRPTTLPSRQTMSPGAAACPQRRSI